MPIRSGSERKVMNDGKCEDVGSTEDDQRNRSASKTESGWLRESSDGYGDRLFLTTMLILFVPPTVYVI